MIKNEVLPPAETLLHSSPIHSAAGTVMRSRDPTEQAVGSMATKVGPEETVYEISGFVNRGGQRTGLTDLADLRSVGQVEPAASRSGSVSADRPRVSAASS